MRIWIHILRGKPAVVIPGSCNCCSGAVETEGSLKLGYASLPIGELRDYVSKQRGRQLIPTSGFHTLLDTHKQIQISLTRIHVCHNKVRWYLKILSPIFYLACLKSALYIVTIVILKSEVPGIFKLLWFERKRGSAHGVGALLGDAVLLE